MPSFGMNFGTQKYPRPACSTKSDVWWEWSLYNTCYPGRVTLHAVLFERTCSWPTDLCKSVLRKTITPTCIAAVCLGTRHIQLGKRGRYNARDWTVVTTPLALKPTPRGMDGYSARNVVRLSPTFRKLISSRKP